MNPLTLCYLVNQRTISCGLRCHNRLLLISTLNQVKGYVREVEYESSCKMGVKIEHTKFLVRLVQ